MAEVGNLSYFVLVTDYFVDLTVLHMWATGWNWQQLERDAQLYIYFQSTKATCTWCKGITFIEGSSKIATMWKENSTEVVRMGLNAKQREDKVHEIQ